MCVCVCVCVGAYASIMNPSDQPTTLSRANETEKQQQSLVVFCLRQRQTRWRRWLKLTPPTECATTAGDYYFIEPACPGFGQSDRSLPGPIGRIWTGPVPTAFSVPSLTRSLTLSLVSYLGGRWWSYVSPEEHTHTCHVSTPSKKMSSTSSEQSSGYRVASHEGCIVAFHAPPTL